MPPPPPLVGLPSFSVSFRTLAFFPSMPAASSPPSFPCSAFPGIVQDPAQMPSSESSHGGRGWGAKQTERVKERREREREEPLLPSLPPSFPFPNASSFSRVLWMLNNAQALRELCEEEASPQPREKRKTKRRRKDNSPSPRPLPRPLETDRHIDRQTHADVSLYAS